MSTSKSKSTSVAESTELTAATTNPDLSANQVVENNGMTDTTVCITDAGNHSNQAYSPNLFGDETPETVSPNQPGQSDSSVETRSVSETVEQCNPDLPERPKQSRISVKQRRLGLDEYKATYLTPVRIVKRHSVVIEDETWARLERIARILGDRGANVGSMIEAICRKHLADYNDDVEIWRRL